MDLSHDDFEENELVEFKSRLFDGGFSAESLLVSVFLHLAVVFLVIVFAVDRSDPHQDGVIIDLANLTLPAQPAVKSTAPTERPSAVPSPAAPDSGEVVKIPGKEAPIPVEDGAPPKAAEPPVPEVARAEPAEDAPLVTQAAPPFLEPSVPHRHGDYDPLEVYKAAVGLRIRDLTSFSSSFAAHMGMVGRVVVHLSLDRFGRNVGRPEVCPEHTELFFVQNLPPNLAQRGVNMLATRVVEALEQGAPYAEAPPGVEVPKVLTYTIELAPVAPGVPPS